MCCSHKSPLFFFGGSCDSFITTSDKTAFGCVLNEAFISKDVLMRAKTISNLSSHVFPLYLFYLSFVPCASTVLWCLFVLASLGWLLQCLKGVHHCLCYLWAWFNWAGTSDAQSESCSCWLKHSHYQRQFKAVINAIHFSMLRTEQRRVEVQTLNYIFWLLLFFRCCFLLVFFVNNLLIRLARVIVCVNITFFNNLWIKSSSLAASHDSSLKVNFKNK